MCIMYAAWYAVFLVFCWSASLRESETVTETGREGELGRVGDLAQIQMPVIAECLSL
jgi:hypothetical protein